ncbi:MAG TPA: YihY/virulence factor BrkB family protein [Candidatus Limnocylindrales bacterium]|nr:YihY/virulence factor BrkB family protein [Candidatus Limnocylindrales bacterium]
MDRKDIVKLFKESFKGWLKENAPIRAAALTFFIILPLPSLLLIVISAFAAFSSQSHAKQVLIQQISSLAGPVVAQLFNQLLASATSPFTSVWAAITVVGFSLAGAIGAFAILRDTMNAIWEVKVPKTLKIGDRIRRAVGPFFLISSLGLIVIAGTVISTGLFSVIKLFSINETMLLISFTFVQVLLSFGLSTLLFAIIYKVLPDKKIHWRDVILPAAMTGVASTVTNFILGIYLQTFTVTTVIGAAGSLIIILLWIYVLNQILLFGAELSKVYATTIGPHPNEHLSPETQRILKSLGKAEEKITKIVLLPLPETPEKAGEKAKAQSEPQVKPELPVQKSSEIANAEKSAVERKEKS